MSKARRERYLSSGGRPEEKWPAYAGLLLLAGVAESAVLGRVTALPAIPRLLPLLAAAIAFFEGPAVGIWLGLAAGVLSWLIAGEVGLLWFCPLAALGCASTRDKTLGRTFLGWLLCALAVVCCYEGGKVLWYRIFLGRELESLLGLALREGGTSLLFAPLWYLFCWRTWDRNPGEMRAGR